MQTETTKRSNRRRSSWDLTIAFCFVAGGWAFLEWRYFVVGGICFGAALTWPLLSVLLDRYQSNYAERDRARTARESQQLQEIARAEKEQSPPDQSSHK